MSWDIVIFNTKQKISSLEEIDSDLLSPIDFNSILEMHFPNIVKEDDHREIKGENYNIQYFADPVPTTNLLLSLSEEQSLFELICIAKIYGWQIFDTGIGQMIDTDHPEKNGYQNFQQFLKHVLRNSNDLN